MAETAIGAGVVFDVQVQTDVAAAPEQVWAVVSDLARSAEWSAECVGGTWVSGSPATVGAVFRGENTRTPDVVAWAPVVRGSWHTESEVIEAVPGHRLSWAIRTKAGVPQDSVWSWRIEPRDGGSTVIHHFRMGTPTEGIGQITSGMNDAERDRFFAEWSEKLHGDIAATVDRVKGIVEKG